MYVVFLDDMQLPIAPERIQTTINNNNKTVNLINEGEVNILKKANLTDISFDIRIPHNPLPFAQELRPVKYYLNKLELLKVNQIPFPFIVNRPGLYHTDMKVSLENYTIDEDASNGKMTIIPVELKYFEDYVDIEAKIEEVVENGKKVIKVQQVKDRLDVKPRPKQVVARSGETLWTIAKKYFGDGSKYTQLAKLNNLSNPNGILAGQVIRLE